jgi:uncharacterized protein (UPF0332 family)
MTVQAVDLWDRALQSLSTARKNLPDDPDASAFRSYYAAFYAVSALFSLRGMSFTRHSAVEAAVHRDLVKLGLWPVERGVDYSYLLNMRVTGDYGGELHVSAEEANDAIESARRILAAVSVQSEGKFIFNPA